MSHCIVTEARRVGGCVGGVSPDCYNAEHRSTGVQEYSGWDWEHSSNFLVVLPTRPRLSLSLSAISCSSLYPALTKLTVEVTSHLLLTFMTQGIIVSQICHFAVQEFRRTEETFLL